MMFLSTTKVLITIIIFVSLFISACSKVTQENYEKIKLGMAYEIGMTNCRWESNGKYIKIQFIADKVVLFSAKGLS
jgi:hypothetical protein